MLNDESAKLIKCEEVYPDGANAPTIVKTYECACGMGTIDYATVPGFSDDYARIDCKACQEKYRIQLACGHYWELISK